MNSAIKLLAISVLGMGGQQAHATSIVFDYGYDSNNFFDTPAKKDALEAAGSFFSSRLNDSLSAIDSAGNNHFNATFSNPGGTGNLVTINDFDVAANTLTVFAGGREIAGSTIGIGGPGGYSASGTSQAFFDTFNRGQTDVGTTDFAPWGGAITFDTQASWYFDNDVSTVESFLGNDFYSVAVHELGHLLGIGTAGSWDNFVNGGSFIGTASNAVFGGDVPLHSDGSHWADGTMSLVDALSQEASMDPSILTGSRKYFTDLDLAGLTDVGWEVSAVPVPAAVYFFGSALLGLGAFRKKAK